MFNKTNFEHAIYAALMQLFIWFFTGNWWLGAAFGSAFFLGREHAQREYEISNPLLLKGYEAFDFWNWKLDSLMDLLFPVITVVCIALITGYLI